MMTAHAGVSEPVLLPTALASAVVVTLVRNAALHRPIRVPIEPAWYGLLAFSLFDCFAW